MFRTFVGGILAVAISASSGQADSLDLTLSGASPGGLWSLIGAGVDRAVKADDPDGVVTYQTSGGGFANLALLAANKADLGLVHDAEAILALQGKEPFNAPITNLKAIGYMYNWAPMHFVLTQSVAEQYGIDSIDDLATSGAPLRIGINRKGNINANIVAFMLEAAGLDEATLEANGGSFVRAASKQQSELIQDGRIDMATNGIFVGHSSIRAIDENVDVVLLTMPPEIIAATNEAFGTSPSTIPAGSYSKQPAEIASLSLGAMILASDTMTDDTAGKVAESLIKNLDALRDVHGAMKPLTAELVTSQKILPFHPGAEAVYRDAGLID